MSLRRERLSNDDPSLKKDKYSLDAEVEIARREAYEALNRLRQSNQKHGASTLPVSDKPLTSPLYISASLNRGNSKGSHTDHILSPTDETQTLPIRQEILSLDMMIAQARKRADEENKPFDEDMFLANLIMERKQKIPPENRSPYGGSMSTHGSHSSSYESNDHSSSTFRPHLDSNKDIQLSTDETYELIKARKQAESQSRRFDENAFLSKLATERQQHLHSSTPTSPTGPAANGTSASISPPNMKTAIVTPDVPAAVLPTPPSATAATATASVARSADKASELALAPAATAASLQSGSLALAAEVAQDSGAEVTPVRKKKGKKKAKSPLQKHSTGDATVSLTESKNIQDGPIQAASSSAAVSNANPSNASQTNSSSTSSLKPFDPTTYDKTDDNFKENGINLLTNAAERLLIRAERLSDLKLNLKIPNHFDQSGHLLSAVNALDSAVSIFAQAFDKIMVEIAITPIPPPSPPTPESTVKYKTKTSKREEPTGEEAPKSSVSLTTSSTSLQPPAIPRHDSSLSKGLKSTPQDHPQEQEFDDEEEDDDEEEEDSDEEDNSEEESEDDDDNSDDGRRRTHANVKKESNWGTLFACVPTVSKRRNYAVDFGKDKAEKTEGKKSELKEEVDGEDDDDEEEDEDDEEDGDEDPSEDMGVGVKLQNYSNNTSSFSANNARKGEILSNVKPLQPKQKKAKAAPKQSESELGIVKVKEGNREVGFRNKSTFVDI